MDKLTDFYSVIPKSFIQEYHNPSYKKHMLKIPFRMLIIGGSGSGKTTLVLEILKRMPDTFAHITLCCRDQDEPLYKYLKSKIDEEQLTIYENGNIPDLSTLDKDIQNLVIFDDLVLTKDQSKIEEYYIRGRKHGKGISMMYLSQSYFRIPKTIRLQANYIILKKLSSTRDLNIILLDFNLGIKKEDLTNMYRYCTDEKRNFLLVDIDETLDKRFRKNFLEVLN